MPTLRPALLALTLAATVTTPAACDLNTPGPTPIPGRHDTSTSSTDDTEDVEFYATCDENSRPIQVRPNTVAARAAAAKACRHAGRVGNGVADYLNTHPR
ncbi:hypothetical protein [Amycolatopsis minnesotensis]|uniref:Secreted protein n=1 Tax=Amycolatopsis minnesotensis TaxID=337894 RepID=A0ABN2SAM6_9PSEU